MAVERERDSQTESTRARERERETETENAVRPAAEGALGGARVVVAESAQLPGLSGQASARDSVRQPRHRLLLAPGGPDARPRHEAVQPVRLLPPSLSRPFSRSRRLRAEASGLRRYKGLSLSRKAFRCLRSIADLLTAAGKAATIGAKPVRPHCTFASATHFLI